MMTRSALVAAALLAAAAPAAGLARALAPACVRIRSAVTAAPSLAGCATGRRAVVTPRARSLAPVALAAANGGDAKAAMPAALAQLSSRLWAWGWINWWVQGALSVVSAVLLLFANSVTASAVSAPALAGRAIALGACAASFSSTFWAWGYTRLASRFRRHPDRWSSAKAGGSARSALAIGTAINLVGIGLAIVGAEAIVGTLAAKALTQGSAVVLDAKAAAATIQALDVLVVQANTNTLAACFCGLLTAMRLKVAAAACVAAPPAALPATP